MILRLVGKRLRKTLRCRNLGVRVQPVPLLTGMLALMVSSSTVTYAQGVSSFLPSNRTIDWTHAGIPGGIPDANWPICKTIAPSGGTDDSVTIQSAINSCPAGSVVVLTAGTYTLHRASTVCYGKSDDYATGVYEAGLCLTDKSIVLRGAGPNNTVLKYGDGANIISMGETYLSLSSVDFVPVTSTALQGATQLTLSSVSTNITVNSYIVVTQTNPTDSGWQSACEYLWLHRVVQRMWTRPNE